MNAKQFCSSKAATAQAIANAEIDLSACSDDEARRICDSGMTPQQVHAYLAQRRATLARSAPSYRGEPLRDETVREYARDPLDHATLSDEERSMLEARGMTDPDSVRAYVQRRAATRARSR